MRQVVPIVLLAFSSSEPTYRTLAVFPVPVFP